MHSIYSLSDGLFTGAMVSIEPFDAARLAEHLPKGFSAMEGSWPHLKFKVDLETGNVQQFKPPQPPTNEFVIWQWDEAAWSWVATESTAAKAAILRTQRDELLQQCDWTQLPDCRITVVKRAEWATYRQLLREVPAQPGFPEKCTWPNKPA